MKTNKYNNKKNNNRNNVIRRTPAAFLALGFAGGAFGIILLANVLYTAVEAAIKGFTACVAATFSPVVVFAVGTIAAVIFGIVAVKRFGEKKRREGARGAYARCAEKTPKQPKKVESFVADAQPEEN